jgi:mRNA-degrading endonuclease toxin of MazEF toxin-antitoxin module
MKDFDKWNNSKKKINKKFRPLIKQGRIYWCNLGLNIGVEQDGKGDNFQRLVIVIKKFSNQFALIAPLTSKLHTGNWYLDMHILDKNAQVILNQIKPVDTKRLLEEVG